MARKTQYALLRNALITVVIALIVVSTHAGTEPLTFQELMKFRQIDGAVISKDAGWIAYALKPDRGEGEAVARSVDGDTEYRVERGGNPLLSGDAAWFAAAILPTQKERDEAAEKKRKKKNKEKKDEDEPRKGLALVSLEDGTRAQFDEVESFALSDDGRWLAYKMYEVENDEAEDKTEKEKRNKYLMLHSRFLVIRAIIKLQWMKLQEYQRLVKVQFIDILKAKRSFLNSFLPSIMIIL